MKIRSFNFFLTLLITMIGFSCGQSGSVKNGRTEENVKLKNGLDSTSYAIGVQMGDNIVRHQKDALPGVDSLNMDVLLQAFTEMVRDGKAKMNPSDAEMVIRTFIQKNAEIVAQKNLEASNAFLEKNKKRKDVITTKSGLQYKILIEGNGPKPKLKDKVRVDYTGRLLDGTIYDSSEQRGGPQVFVLDNVIKGWAEALQMMPAGSRWILYIPPDLAFGQRGQGRDIGPNMVLVIDVRLIDLQ